MIQYLYVARGSKAELDTQIQIGINLGYFTPEAAAETLRLSRETGQLLNAFISKINNK